MCLVCWLFLFGWFGLMFSVCPCVSGVCLFVLLSSSYCRRHCSCVVVDLVAVLFVWLFVCLCVFVCLFVYLLACLC